MPSVPGDIDTFNGVYEDTCRSVVGLLVGEVEAGAGFIVHTSDEITVIAVHSSCTRDVGTEMITVSFFNGIKAWANDIVKLNDGGLDLVMVGVKNGGWTHARLGQLGTGESEIVLTIVPLVCPKSQWQRTYTSYIISPNCNCVSVTGSRIHKMSELFSYTLPVGNKVPNFGTSMSRWFPIDHSVLGSPVFNMKGEWVGFPLKCSASSSDMKLGMRGEVFQQSLNKWLDGRRWEVVVQPYVEKNAKLAAPFDWY